MGELELGLEVGDRPQAADEEPGADPVAEGDRQAVERLRRPRAARAPARAASAARMTATRVSASRSGDLRGLPSTATTTRSKTRAARRDDVEVAVRDRVERARVDRDPHASPASSSVRR